MLSSKQSYNKVVIVLPKVALASKEAPQTCVDSWLALEMLHGKVAEAACATHKPIRLRSYCTSNFGLGKLLHERGAREY